MAKPESTAALKTAPDPATEEGPKEEKRQPKPKKALPTFRIAVPKQLDILRGYVHASGQEGKGVRLNDLASIMKMHANTVTLANPFFSDIGLITRGDGGYVPSSDVIAYVGAYDWNPEKAAHKLSPTIEGTWFAKLLMPKLRMRPMDETEAISELAAEASAGTDYKAQIRMLLEFMEVTGLISRENGKVTKRNSQLGGEPGNERPPGGESEPSGQSGGKASTVFTTFSQPTEGVVRFNVSVKVDMAEFAGWRPDRIASFFSGIAQVLAAKGALEKDASE